MVTFADAIDADALRIRHEFLEMPGLVLTVAQTARSYYTIPAGTEGDTVYQVAFPSHILSGLPCAPAPSAGG